MPDPKPRLLDVRPETDFSAGHMPESVNIPLEDLSRRVHELPPGGSSIHVTDADASRADEAVRFLTERGYQAAAEPFDLHRLTESGPSRNRLWEPSPFLIEVLDRVEAPDHKRALDVACGSGREAAYLALHGWDVLGIDVLPDALSRAEDLASRSGVRIATRRQDLQRDPRLDVEAFDLVTAFRFLHRDLFGAIRSAVKPGGYVAYETFHASNRETGRPPRSDAHLLGSGELQEHFEGFELLILRDAFERAGRRYSHVLARKPSR